MNFSVILLRVDCGTIVIKHKKNLFAKSILTKMLNNWLFKTKMHKYKKRTRLRLQE